jgi:ABC-type amino acid transport substrate-binding protein
MTANASLLSAFTPTGKLCAAINLGNPILANKDAASGQPIGVSIDLARELAGRLGAELELVVFDAALKSVEAILAPAATSTSSTCGRVKLLHLAMVGRAMITRFDAPWQDVQRTL